MKLSDAFDVQQGDVIAFVGAGGKTSTLMALGAELSQRGWRVLLTTTTRVGRQQLDMLPAIVHTDAPMNLIDRYLKQYRAVFVYHHWNAVKVWGASVNRLRQIRDVLQPDVILIEADGARGALLKAPYAHEPVVPDWTTKVIVCASVQSVNQTLNDRSVYHPEGVSQLTNTLPEDLISAEIVGTVLATAYPKLPEFATVFGWIPSVPVSGYLRGIARRIADVVLETKSNRIEAVVLGDVRMAEPVHEVVRPVAAIILAGGMSRRMGQSKVLLPWGEHTVIEQIVERVMGAGVQQIVVVTGHLAEQVTQQVTSYPVQVVFNSRYQAGDMLSSLQTGLQALPESVGAALVVLGDQPRLQSETIERVVQAYREGQGAIVAPSYEMRRGHPILIDRQFWPELLALPLDGAPRDVINQHADDIAYVLVENDSVLRDIDTPQQYDDERRRAGLIE